jgi:hypothetical protein
MPKEELIVATARRLLPLGVALMLGACASEPPAAELPLSRQISISLDSSDCEVAR